MLNATLKNTSRKYGVEQQASVVEHWWARTPREKWKWWKLKENVAGDMGLNQSPVYSSGFVHHSKNTKL